MASEAVADGESSQLLSLPKELQIEIIGHAIPRRIVFFTAVLSIKPKASSSVINLLLSCKKIHDLVLFHFRDGYEIKPIADSFGPPLDLLEPVSDLWKLHPTNDTLCIIDSMVPTDALLRASGDLATDGFIFPSLSTSSLVRTGYLAEGRVSIPVRRIINCCLDCSRLDMGGLQSDVDDIGGFQLDIFPNLEEATLIIGVADTEWEVPEPHLFRPRDWSQDGLRAWGSHTQPQNLETAGRDTQDGPPDIDKRWAPTFPWQRYGIGLCNRYGRHKMPDVLPFIGTHGYSDTSLVSGGHWAGFRLFTKTGTVQFTPLDWCDVEQAFDVCGTLAADGELHRTLLIHELSMPGFVARVWIDPPVGHGSKYRWVDVRQAKNDEEDLTMQGITRIWAMVRHRMQEQSVCPGYQLSAPSESET